MYLALSSGQLSHTTFLTKIIVLFEGLAICDVIVVTEVVSSGISELFSDRMELECNDCDSCIDDPIQPY